MLQDYVAIWDGDLWSKAELKWWAFSRQLLLLLYLRPLWATMGHYLQGYSSLKEPQPKSKPTTSQQRAARPCLRLSVDTHMQCFKVNGGVWLVRNGSTFDSQQVSVF